MDEAREVAAARRCSVVAPAGCGKTYLIAYAVTHYGGERELVLTHTHAGVDALRRRLRLLGSRSASCAVDTIAGWALRLAAAFPKSSALATAIPTTREEWNDLYTAARKLLGGRLIQRILKASYSGIYVDEYQDCTLDQHALVTMLADILPCRVLGDPLQSIFGFGGEPVVDWGKHVVGSFDGVAGPIEPWRWKRANPALGNWLLGIRDHLLAGRQIDLGGAPHGLSWRTLGEPKWQSKNRRDACFATRVKGESTAALCAWSAQSHKLARSLGGIFSCVEPIDAPELYNFARDLDSKAGQERAVALIDFAAECMTEVKSEMKTIRSALESGKKVRSTKCPEQREALQRVVDSKGMEPVLLALDSLVHLPRAHVFRWELLNEARRSLRAKIAGEHSCVYDAAWAVRSRTRQVGRPMSKCTFGTTLLLKGLEFDHAIVLDADDMNANNLYVALTRGSKTLTVVSKSPILTPKASCGRAVARNNLDIAAPVGR